MTKHKIVLVLASAFLLIALLAVGCAKEAAPASTPAPTISPTPTLAPTPIIVSTAIGNCTVYDAWVTQGNMTLEYYSKDHVLSDVIAQSVAFAKFYYAECGNISGDIRWCLWPEMPSNYTALSEAPNYILLGEVPVKEVPSTGIPPAPDEAFIIAHELAGFVLDARGYPWVESNYAALADVVTSLDDIASSPKRDSIIAQYGFDLRGRYSELVDIASTALNHDLDVVNIGNVSNVVVMFKYLRAEAYWRYALGNKEWAATDLYKEVHNNQDLSWFADYTDQLLTIIGNNGFDTPEHMNNMFIAIINYFGLQGYVVTTFNPQ